MLIKFGFSKFQSSFGFMSCLPETVTDVDKLYQNVFVTSDPKMKKTDHSL